MSALSVRAVTATLAALALTAPVGAAAATGTTAVARSKAPGSFTSRVVEPTGATGDGTSAVAVDAAGRVAGNILSGTTPTQGFTGTPGAVRRLPGGENSVARDIAAGTVVGSTADGADEPWLQVPARWTRRATAPQTLPIAWPADHGFFRSGTAVAVATSGVIAGTVPTGYHSGASTTWDAAGRGGVLRTLGGGTWALTATDIANNGLVVGYDENRRPNGPSDTRARAVVIERGTVRALPGGSSSSKALAVSDSGRHIVGTVDGVLARFSRTAAPTTLATDVVPAAVTNSGDIVGNRPGADGHAGTGDDVPALVRSGRVVELPGLVRLPTGWNLTHVADINSRGVVVGTATDPTGRPHAVLLTPTR